MKNKRSRYNRNEIYKFLVCFVLLIIVLCDFFINVIVQIILILFREILFYWSVQKLDINLSLLTILGKMK